MRGPNLNLNSLIIQRISDSPLHKVWTPVDFLDLGSRSAVDKALQRNVAASRLRRIDRGLYDQPRQSVLTGKIAAPDYRSVIDAVGRRDQVRMLIDGITAANDMGLTDAVPAQVIVHTDGRLRPIQLDNLTIRFQVTAASKLYWANRPGMRIVQALHWLRDSLSQNSDQVFARLLRLLQTNDPDGSIRKDLQQGLHTIPAWMQDFLRKLLHAADTSDTTAITPSNKSSAGNQATALELQ